MEKAVIDRFEDQNHAVLLVGKDEKEYHVSRTSLPDDVKEGNHLFVVLENEQVISVELDKETTTEAVNRIGNKMDKLREMKRMKRRAK
ncbi:hypothetical protein J2S05_002452 [Alkalicoccobacillus murimartini]|uniref:DUF3006 domain-containing protein n=1 Tax=Alkalicoccobacillus murimartini TaxID=171685 RepID=A0ABT9YIH1_9BACI|nr:hypothetical protein [Alkalicoccobacillus murimartini]